MTLASPKGFSTISAFPRTLSSIAVSVGGLAMFLIFASWLLISYPVGSTVSGYFYEVDKPPKFDLPIFRASETGGNAPLSGYRNDIFKKPPSEFEEMNNLTQGRKSVGIDPSITSKIEDMVDQSVQVPAFSSNLRQEDEPPKSSDSRNDTEVKPVFPGVLTNASYNARPNDTNPGASRSNVDTETSLSNLNSYPSQNGSISSGSCYMFPPSVIGTIFIFFEYWE